MFPRIMRNQNQKAAYDITSSYKVYMVETTIPTLSLLSAWPYTEEFYSLESHC